MKNLLILLVSLWASTAWADPAADPSGLWNTFDKDLSFQKDLFIKFISLILKKNNKTRYLSKNTNPISKNFY